MNGSRRGTTHRSPHAGQPGRRGVVIVELLIWLPVLMTALMAVVEFALMQQVNQQVALASRHGAKIASEVTRAFAVSPNLSDINTGNLQSRIDIFLANAGLTASCEVRLEHNACVNNPSQVDTAMACTCNATGPGVLPAGEPPQGEAYVRITVCVPLTGNVPNLLSTLGYDFTGLIVRHSTTYRVETNNSAPATILRLQTLPAGVAFGFGGPTPVTTPSTNFIRLDVNRAIAPDPISLTFDGNLTTDLETPFAGLTLTWTKTGAPASAGAGTTFNASFDVPNNVLDPDIDHFVNLTATDPCGGSRTRTLQVRVRRVL